MYLQFSWQEFQNATSFPVNYKTFRFTSDSVEKSEFEASFLSPFLLEALAPLNSQFDWQSSHFFPPTNRRNPPVIAIQGYVLRT